MKDAFAFYKRSSRLDLDNYNDDTKDGLHITSMAGGWMTIVQGFAGMRVINNKLCFEPKIPAEWKSYSFNIFFRGNIVNVCIANKQSKFTLIKGTKLDIMVNNKKVSLTKGKEVIVK